MSSHWPASRRPRQEAVDLRRVLLTASLAVPERAAWYSLVAAARYSTPSSLLGCESPAIVATRFQVIHLLARAMLNVNSGVPLPFTIRDGLVTFVLVESGAGAWARAVTREAGSSAH